MTHPDILQAERTGYPAHMQPESPALECEDCGGEIYGGETYSSVGICLDCADRHTWTHWPDEGDEPLHCEDCGGAIEPQALYVSLPDGDGDFCEGCFEKTKIAAWAA